MTLRILLVLLISVSSIAQAQTWTSVSGFPGGARAGAVMFAIGDTLYAGGGENSSGVTDSDFYAYSITSQKWMKEVFAKSQGGAQPVTRGLGVALVIGNIAYVGLGRKQTSQGIVALSDWWQYSPVSGWTRLTDLPGTPCYQTYAFTIGLMGYVGGGTNTGGADLTNFYSYDPSADKWTGLNMPAFGATADAASFGLGKYGYVACGSQGFANPVMQALWRYDPTGDAWTQMKDFPGSPREACSGFALNGKGYVGLGTVIFQTYYSDIYAYDTAHDSWAKSTSLPPMRGRASTAVTGNMAFVGFGSNQSTTSFFNSISSVTIGVPPNSVAAPQQAAPLILFPNPTHDRITISHAARMAAPRVVVVNELGVEVLSQQLDASGTLDLSGLPSGVYEVVAGELRQRVVKE